MREPNLFIVGAPKCGTTSLHHYLNQHPDIFMADMKETNYFAKDIRREELKKIGGSSQFSIRKRKQYLGLFKDAGDASVIGEASPLYMLSHVAAEEIHRFNSKARMVVMLRDPVELMFSWHAQNRLDGRESLPFEEAIVAGDGRLSKFFQYKKVCVLSEQVKRFTSLFPRKQIRFIVLDDLKKDPSNVYKETLRFLGVDDSFKADLRPRNVRKTIKRPLLHKLALFLKKIPGRSLVPRSIRRVVLVGIRRVATGSGSKEMMDKDVERRLRADLEPEVDRLGKLVGRDLLKLWGYRLT